MNKLRLVLKFVKGEWCDVHEISKIFHVEPHILCSLYEHKRDVATNMTVIRIDPIPKNCALCDENYVNCIYNGRCKKKDEKK